MLMEVLTLLKNDKMLLYMVIKVGGNYHKINIISGIMVIWYHGSAETDYLSHRFRTI